MNRQVKQFQILIKAKIKKPGNVVVGARSSKGNQGKEVAFESPEKSVGFFRVSCRLLLLYIFGCDYRVSVEIEAMNSERS